MIKVNFNGSWEFCFDKDLDAYNKYGLNKYIGASGAASRFYDNSNWEKITLPHDWAVAMQPSLDASTMAGARPNTHYHRCMTEKRSEAEDIREVAWYRKQFFAPAEWKDKRIFIEFEGVFRDAAVWVNGEYQYRHFSGYTSFTLEITDHIVFGEDNGVAVRVNSENNEGWWYEGSGIYRNVNLYIAAPTYFKRNKTFVRAAVDGTVSVSGVLVNDEGCGKSTEIEYRVLDRDGKEVAGVRSAVELSAFSETQVAATLSIDNPTLWDLSEPYLYTLVMSVEGEEERVRFGVRSVGFDANRGFLLNGKPVKVRGACVHQDLGGVGVALTDNLIYYKIARLKEMGCNAYRSSHHAPSPVLLDACDELGMLVMDETRTFGTSVEAVKQLTDLIERDRNHPSVFIWSLGNEEFDVQNSEWSARLMQKMTRLTKDLDDTRPVTYSGNNGDNFTGANGVSEVRGVNYIRNQGRTAEFANWLDQYHYDHPEQPIIGTEESSYVLSRGGAVNDFGSGKLDSTGNVTMRWGSTPKGWVKFMEQRDYFAGSFMWTGFDYRGETNPFYTTNNSSSFGTIDLCGMAKPPFYYYKAWWTDEPVLKLTPHWNGKKGDTLTVAVMTNCERITLSLNGKPVCEQAVEKFDMPVFSLDFEPGTLEVTGVKSGKTYRDSLTTHGKTAALTVSKAWDCGDGGIGIYEVSAFDADGNPCYTANDGIEYTVSGGELVGVGNGDPARWEREQPHFEEKAKYITSFNYEKGLYLIPSKAKNSLTKRYSSLVYEEKNSAFDDDYRIVDAYYGAVERRENTFTCTIDGAYGYEYIEFERFGGEATVYLNGKKIGDNIRQGSVDYKSVRPYRFYAKFRKGSNELKVVVKTDEFSTPPVNGCVKIGKQIKVMPPLSLHYGKARLFVRGEATVTAKIKK